MTQDKDTIQTEEFIQSQRAEIVHALAHLHEARESLDFIMQLSRDPDTTPAEMSHAAITLYLELRNVEYALEEVLMTLEEEEDFSPPSNVKINTN